MTWAVEHGRADLGRKIDMRGESHDQESGRERKS